MKMRGIILITILFSFDQLRAQGLEYRFSLVDEGTINRIRTETPLNYQNRIIPQ